MSASRDQFGNSDPHAGLPLHSSGPAPEEGVATLVLLHGRGGRAEGMLSLYDELALPRLAALAPEGAGSTWYPHSFLASLESNQPYLDSALARLESIVADLVSRGVSSDRIALLGFSQGACLALEFVARHPRRYGAVMGLTGGLIGPPGSPRDYEGSLEATPVFLGASDPDPHVPFSRVEETQAVLKRMEAEVELRRYPGLPHTISQDQLDTCRSYLKRIVSPEGEGGR